MTALLAGLAGTDLEFVRPDGERGTLRALVESYGLRAVDRPELGQLTDQDTFTVTMDFSDLEGASIECARGAVPMPQNIYALYRLHQSTESVKLASFQGQEGVNAFTGVSSNWKKQITLVSKLLPDGRRSLYFATDDPSAPRTVVDRRKDDEPQE